MRLSAAELTAHLLKCVRNALFLIAVSSLIPDTAHAQTVLLEWDYPHFRAVADGFTQPPGGPNAFELEGSWQRGTQTVACRYDSQPCRTAWLYVTSCTPPGNYTANAYKDRTSLRASQPFTVPEWSRPTVSVSQPYLPVGSPSYRLPVTADLPQFGTAFSCPEVHRIDGATGAVYSQRYCGPELDPGTASEFEMTLSGSLAPPSTGDVSYLVTIGACDGTSAKDAVQMNLGDPSCNACPDCIADPIRTANGNMRYSEIDPLPGDPVEPFVRTYNSRLGPGLFSNGWSSPLDARVAFASVDNYDDARGVVAIRTSNGDTYVFGLTSGRYEQLSPRGVQQSDLRFDPGADVFSFQRYGSHVSAIFSATTGRVLRYRDTRSGRETQITYTTGGRPTRLSDSWGNWAWTITTDSSTGLVTKIGREGSTKGPYLTYVYDTSGSLLEVRSSANTRAAYRKYVYHYNGLLTSITDGSGRVLENHGYTGDGAASSRGPSGELSYIEYGQPGRVSGERMTRATTPAGSNSDYYLRQIKGRWRTVEIVGRCTSCDLTNTVFGYDANGNLTREQDGRGFVTVRSYDERNRVIVEEGPFLKSGCVPDDVMCRFTPDTITQGALSPTSATRWTTYTYDDNWPAKKTSTTRSSAYVPDESQSEVRTYDPATGNLRTLDITGWTDIPARAETRRTTHSSYDGVEGAVFDPGGSFSSSWLALPQPRALTKSADGPRTDVSDVTTYVYYPLDSSVTAGLRGRLAAVRTPEGNIARFESYDTFGNVLRYVDKNGVATDYTYDALGRILTSKIAGVRRCDTAADPLCATDLVTTMTYDATIGPVRTMVRPGGAVTHYEYDWRGRRIAEARGPAETDLRERQLFAYDDSSNQVREVSLQANVASVWVTKSSIRHVFDRDGRIWRTFVPPFTAPDTDGVHIEYTYDQAGNLRAVKDERHTTPNTQYDVDAVGSVVETRQLHGSRWVRTGYGYDANHNLIVVTDPHLNRTIYTVDDFGQVLRTISPVTGTTTATYDAAGNLTQLTDARGAITTRVYDAADRMIQSTHSLSSGTETITRTYDDAAPNRYARGRLSAMSDPSGTTQYSYDRRGLLRREDRVVAGVALTTSYRYDAAGNRTGVTYPSGRTATYAFDFAARPIGATGKSPTGAAETYATGAAYLPFGPLTSLTFGNGLTLRQLVDDRYRPTTRALLDGASPVASFDYRYDAGSNILSISDTVTPAFSRAYEYDDLSRLTVANSSGLWGAGSFEYDAMGNMTIARLGSSVRSFTQAGTTPLVSSVTDASGTAYPSYDVAGNLLSAGPADQRAYSARNLVTGRTTNEASLAYDYDGRNIRVSSTRTTNGVTLRTRMTYDPELHLLEHAPDAATPIDFIWLGEQPIAQAAGATVTYTYADHLGTPLLQIDQAKNVTWRAEYEPFGRIHHMRVGTTAGQLLRFPGQDADLGGDADEHYNIFRWYQPLWGRYTQADPFGIALSDTNLYAYVGGNPVAYKDPRGLVKIKQEFQKLGGSFGFSGQYNLAFGQAYTNGKCVGCDGKWNIELSLLFVHGYYCTGDSACQTEVHHAMIASAFVSKAAQEYKKYEQEAYDSKVVCEAMAAFYAKSLKEYMTATNNAWPPELIKAYVQTQQLYEETHHGWPCGWVPGCAK